MMKNLRRFEGLDAWQFARALTKDIYTISKKGGLGKDYGLKDQIRCASVSVMSNIAEGHGHRGSKQFARYLSIAKASATEVQSLLYVLLDANYIHKETFDELYDRVDQTISLIAGLERYLRTKT